MELKKILFIFLSLLIPLNIYASDTGPIEGNELEVIGEVQESNGLASNAKSAILIDANTKEILFEKNSHEKLAPASMTKMMSMLLVIEAIEDGVIGWKDIVTVSENASGMGGSQILLETNEKMSVYDLFKGVAVASGNDAIVALAEATYGTTDTFVAEMNKKAKELGLRDTNFKNVHGLDVENHYSSSYDMAIVASELARHEKVFEFTSIYEDYLRKGTPREFWLTNTNKLVRFYNGVDGLKTGYTPEAGYCLTATIKKDDMRLISVVMGEPSSTIRNKETTELLNYGFSQYKTTNVVRKNHVITEVDFPKAEDIKVKITPIDNVNILTKKSEKIGNITYKAKVDNISFKTKVNDKVGTLFIYEDNKLIKETPLTIEKELKRASFLTLYKRYISDLITGNIKY